MEVEIDGIQDVSESQWVQAVAERSSGSRRREGGSSSSGGARGNGDSDAAIQLVEEEEEEGEDDDVDEEEEEEDEEDDLNELQADAARYARRDKMDRESKSKRRKLGTFTSHITPRNGRS